MNEEFVNTLKENPSAVTKYISDTFRDAVNYIKIDDILEGIDCRKQFKVKTTNQLDKVIREVNFQETKIPLREIQELEILYAKERDNAWRPKTGETSEKMQFVYCFMLQKSTLNALLTKQKMEIENLKATIIPKRNKILQQQRAMMQNADFHC